MALALCRCFYFSRALGSIRVLGKPVAEVSEIVLPRQRTASAESTSRTGFSRTQGGGDTVLRTWRPPSDEGDHTPMSQS